MSLTISQNKVAWLSPAPREGNSFSVRSILANVMLLGAGGPGQDGFEALR